MKKLAVLAVAAMLVFSLAGQAAAYFEDFNLIRTIYSTQTSLEVGSDLGADVRLFNVAPYPVQPILGLAVPPTNPVNQFTAGMLNLVDVGGAGALSTLKIAYYAHGFGDGTNENGKDFYATGFLTTPYGGTDDDALSMYGKRQSNADAVYNNTQSYYSTFGTSTAFGDKGNVNSYWSQFDKSGLSIGGMATHLTESEMEVSLANLLSVGYVDQLLYYIDYNGSSTTKAGVEKTVIRTFLTSDGQRIDLSGDKIATVINPSAVPIPGSVLLLASGLLGIFGFRRKRA